jgi:hypothetical protein
LVTAVLSAEHHVHDLPVSIQDRRPHLEAEPAVLLLQYFTQHGPERVVVGEELGDAADSTCGAVGELSSPHAAAATVHPASSIKA